MGGARHLSEGTNKIQFPRRREVLTLLYNRGEFRGTVATDHSGGMDDAVLSWYLLAPVSLASRGPLEPFNFYSYILMFAHSKTYPLVCSPACIQHLNGNEFSWSP